MSITEQITNSSKLSYQPIFESSETTRSIESMSEKELVEQVGECVADFGAIEQPQIDVELFSENTTKLSGLVSEIEARGGIEILSKDERAMMGILTEKLGGYNTLREISLLHTQALGSFLDMRGHLETLQATYMSPMYISDREMRHQQLEDLYKHFEENLPKESLDQLKKALNVYIKERWGDEFLVDIASISNEQIKNAKEKVKVECLDQLMPKEGEKVYLHRTGAGLNSFREGFYYSGGDLSDTSTIHNANTTKDEFLDALFTEHKHNEYVLVMRIPEKYISNMDKEEPFSPEILKEIEGVDKNGKEITRAIDNKYISGMLVLRTGTFIKNRNFMHEGE